MSTTAASYERGDPAAGAPFPAARMAALHEGGLLTAPLPPSCGGAALGLAPGTLPALLRTLAAVGRDDLSTGRLYEGHVDALLLVARYGTPAQLARLARRVRAGALLGVWNTEPTGAGVHVTLTRDGVRLDGRKTFASGAGHTWGAVVTGARSADGGWQMCIVPMRRLLRAGTATVDRSTWQPLGMAGSASYTVDFRDAHLSTELLLGAPGDYYRQPRFTGGAIRFAAVQLGGATRLVDELCAFLRAAGRGDDPYQLARVGEATTLLAGSAALLRDAAVAAERDDGDVATVLAYANAARTAVGECCARVCELVQRSVGARGLLEPQPFAPIVRDLLMYLRQPAPDTALADVGRFAVGAESSVAARLWEAL